MDVKGKVALVTGASSGIGRATALSLAKAGATVVASGRRESRLYSLSEDCRASAPHSCFIAGDISDKAFAQSLVDETIGRFGRLDILINNAAVPMHRPLYEISAEDAEAVMQVNFLSCLWTTFAAIPPMLLQGKNGTDGGCIVNVSSFAATVVPTYETIYAASKGAISSFSRGLWNDLAGSGIHCVLVIPGPIDTEIWGKIADERAYSGRLYPAQLVANEIIAAIRKKQFEVTVPRRNPKLVSAKVFSTFLPSFLRKAVARRNPVSPLQVKNAIARARMGFRMGLKS